MLTTDPRLQQPSLTVQSVDDYLLATELHQEKISLTPYNGQDREIEALTLSIDGQVAGFLPVNSARRFPERVEATCVTISNGTKFYLLAEPVPNLAESIFALLHDDCNFTIRNRVSTMRYTPYDRTAWDPIGRYRYVRGQVARLLYGLLSVRSYTPEGYEYLHCFFDSRWPRMQNFSFEEGRYKKRERKSESGNTQVYEFSDVRTLKPGDPVSWTYAYRRGVFGSNGRAALVCGAMYPVPIYRPETSEDWYDWPVDIHFMRGISWRDWPNFVKGLNGHYFSDFLQALSGRTGRAALTAVRLLEQQKGGTPEGEVLASDPQSGCFSGYEGKFVKYQKGRNPRIVWTLQGEGTIYVVDCPGIGALYIFRDEAVAVGWATHEIDYTEARQKARDWIVHRKGWEQKVDSSLAGLGVSKPLLVT